MFNGGKVFQRLIFFTGDGFEDWEQEHIDNFFAFLKETNQSLPENYPTENVLRNLQATRFNNKKSIVNIHDGYQWRI
jgi:hypothetical protein